MSELNAWNTVDANNNAAPPDGWPENTMQYSEVNNTGRAVQGTLKRYFADVNGSLQAAGVADAYTLTLNETGYVAYFQGMYFACEIQATNTGASTINVNGIGVQTIVDRAGTPLAAGEIQAGGIYEFRYDGTNFQVMGTLAGTATTSDLVLTNSNDPDLVDTDVALNVGATDPTSAQHLEQGPSDIQSKANATTAAALDLNALGGNVTLGQQTGTDGDTVNVYQNAFQIATFDLNTLSIASQTAGDPTVPDFIPIQLVLADQDFGEEYGRIGFDGVDAALSVKNFAEGGDLRLIGQATGGGENTVFSADPDTAALLYFTNVPKVRTISQGAVINGSVAAASPPTSEAVNTQIQFNDLNNVATLGVVGYQGNDDLKLLNFMRGGTTIINAADSGGTIRNMLVCDPNSDVALHQVGVEVARTLTAAAGGFEANNTLTGAGFERVLTASDIGASSLNGLSDVTLTAPVTGGVLYKSAGNWLDTDAVEINPANTVILKYGGVDVFETAPVSGAAYPYILGSGGAIVNNNTTGNGDSRVLSYYDMRMAGKLVNTSRSLTTAVTADPDLQWTGLRAGRHSFEFYLQFLNVNTADFVFEVDGTFVTGGNLVYTVSTTDGTPQEYGALAPMGTQRTINILTAGEVHYMHITGTVLISTNGGTCEFRWGPSVSEIDSLTVANGGWGRCSPFRIT